MIVRKPSDVEKKVSADMLSNLPPVTTQVIIGTSEEEIVTGDTYTFLLLRKMQFCEFFVCADLGKLL